MEIWIDIKNFEGIYQISNMGNVKSLSRKNATKERILKPSPDTGGYLIVRLYLNKKGKSYKIHRLVAAAFVANPENKKEVNHIGKDKNGRIDKTDNRAVSIEWATPAENYNHAQKNGLMDNFVNASSKTSKGEKKVLNTHTGEIYKSAKDAAIKIKIDYRLLTIMLRGDSENNTGLQYAITSNLKNGKIVLNLQTGIFYDSVRNAAETIGVKAPTLRSRLNGSIPNNTNFIYA